MLTTLLRIHTTARRHCEAARRQQARVTAGGPSFDDRTRAGAEKFGPNQPPRRLHAPERSPPRHREVPEGGLHWRSSFRCRSLRCATHSTIHAKNAKSVFHRESNPLPHVPKVFDLPTGPKRSWILESFREMISNGYETRLTYHVTYPGTQGTVSTQSTPPSEGQSHPGRPGPLRAWVGAPRPGPPASGLSLATSTGHCYRDVTVPDSAQLAAAAVPQLRELPPCSSVRQRGLNFG